MYCIVVTNKVKQGREKDYISIMSENAKASCQNEAGCVQFDVVRDRNDPQQFHLYEIYLSEQDLVTHKKTAHYMASRTLLADIIEEQSVVRADVVTTNSKLNI